MTDFNAVTVLKKEIPALAICKGFKWDLRTWEDSSIDEMCDDDAAGASIMERDTSTGHKP